MKVFLTSNSRPIISCEGNWRAKGQEELFPEVLGAVQENGLW